MSNWWKPGWWEPLKRDKSIDDTRTNLTFTDVIFGLTFTQIFIRASALLALSTAVDVHLALSLTVVVGSYIGYRKSLKRAAYKLGFFDLPLFRFVLDLFMVFLYYVLVVTPDETKNPLALVHARTDSLLVLIIFAAYLAWDLISWRMSRQGYTEVNYQGRRTWVTAGGCFAVGILVSVAWTAGSPLNQHLAIAVDSVLIAIVIFYRWAKDSILGAPPQPHVGDPSPGQDDLAADVAPVQPALAKLGQTIEGKAAGS